MRAGGSTKASSDFGSLSPGAGALSAEGGLEESKGVSQSARTSETAHNPTPVALERAWLQMHLEIL